MIYFIIIFVLILFIILLYKLHLDSIITESFESKELNNDIKFQLYVQKKDNTDFDDIESKNLLIIDNKNKKPKIWMYWQTLPGKKKPGYIDLCYQSVKHNCSNCFDIIL
jgi:hypothetical protein